MFVSENRLILLRQRPEGIPQEGDFELVSRPLGEPGEGEVLVRNRWLSVDPYMRGRMTGMKTYIDPFEVGEPLEGGAVGEVVESRSPDFQKGDKVLHMLGWREYALAPARAFNKLPALGVDDEKFLGVLGMPGMTAWTGLNLIAEAQSGERVLVSAASGAVGSLVVQLAAAKGCHVVGMAGSTEKCQWLEAMGAKAINYRETDDLPGALRAASPEGFDVYFENVGGPMLEAALGLMRDHGRIAVCGMIDSYNSTTPPPGPRNLGMVIIRRLRIQGFIVADHWQHYSDFLKEVGPQVAAGGIEARETVVDGLEGMASAFIGLFSGQNVGKMLIRL